MNDDLMTDVLHPDLADTLSLKEWIEHVKKFDDKRHELLVRQKLVAEEVMCRRKGNVTTSSSSNRFTRPNSTASASSSSVARLPPLTQTERELLSRFFGCFKCRMFNVNHRAKDCKASAPDASTYKMLTEADTTMSKNPHTKKEPIAAVTTINTVMPSSVLECETVSDKCVNTADLASLETKYFFWDCLLDGPSVTSPIHMNALIDDGSHLVLINPELVDCLGLR
ncbi:hypothetical protein BV22DRAFT_1131679 [Leucogyrophana mollusca]|uniref:Uncharacterized protein n=1 Tax=Leucogyrophana mollusca TaxID=85980 RepID=A0ACB8BA26_9AGAM|nr:hypothetical protein BV22DRAFT_1131679 [Leucogyrophana mollusca]